MEFLWQEELPHGNSTGQPPRYPAAPADARQHGAALDAGADHDYVRHVRAFAAFLGRSSDTATDEDVRRFQVHQREHGEGEAVIGGAVSALRFLFTVTLDRPDLSRRLVLAPRPRELPDVLSIDEVARLLEAAPGMLSPCAPSSRSPTSSAPQALRAGSPVPGI